SPVAAEGVVCARVFQRGENGNGTGIRCHSRIVSRLESLQVLRRGLPPLGIALLVVRHALSLREAAQPCPLDRRDVNEHVRTAAFGLNEAVTLGGVEPFDFANRHLNSPMLLFRTASGS